MTQIPVAGLHAELALGTAKLSAGVAEANSKLGSLEGRMEGTSRRARKTGDDIDRGLSKGLKGAETSASTFGKRLDMLSNKFNPLFAASKRYEREVDLLNEALKRGVVGQSLYEQNLERLNAELASGAAGFGRAADQAQRFTGAAGDMSFQTGNIAAQFQDIGVQLAGGQSPFLIALQQGTQLNGVFTQMGGGIRGVASGLGSALMSLVSPLSLITIGAIAAGGMLVQWLTSAGEKAVTLDEALGNLSGAVGELQTITDLLSDTDLSGLKEQFGGVNAEILEMLTLQRELALMDAMNGVSQAMTAAMQSMDGFLTSQLDGIKAAFDTTYDNARQIQALMEDVQRAATPEEALAAVVTLREYIESTVGPLTALEGAAYEMARGLLEAESSLRQVVVQADRSETALNGAANEAARLAGSAPGAGWMSGAIGETNLLIGRLIEANRVKQALAAQNAFDRGNKEYSGRGGDPRQFTETGVFKPSDEVVKQADALLNPSASSGGGSGGGGGAGVDNLAREVERLNKATSDGITPLDKYRAGLAKLDQLKAKGLSDAAYSQEMKRLNEELASSNPLVNDLADAFGAFVARGFKDFKGFTQAVLGSFKKMLADMISLAIRNRIMIGIGTTGGGSVAGSVANAALGGGGGGGGMLAGGTGIFGKLLGGFGTGGSLLGGAGLAGGTGLLGGLGNALSGGLGNVFSIGANAAAAGGGLMAGIGAALPVVAAIALVFAAFKKKVTQLDGGIRVTTTGMDSLVETFKTLKTTRFFGLSKKVRTSFEAASDEVADPILKAVSGIQQGAIDAAKSLGVTSDAFEGFSHRMQVSTKGLSDAEAQKKIEEALTGLGDKFAGMVPGLEELQKDGEGALATLSRLSTSLVAVNEVFVDLGLELFDISVAGGGAASAFTDLLGGLEGFAQTTASYYRDFFTEGERTANLTRRLTDAFGDLGLALPDTRDAFRALVESADAAGDRDLVAGLLKLSPAFAMISEAAEDTVARINQALADLKPEDFATALDFNRARGLLAFGTSSAATAPAAAQAALAASTGGAGATTGGMTDTILANINSNIALLWKTIQKFDLDGMPEVRA